MRFSTAALVAGFSATSSAFLLPPNIEEIKKDFKDARFTGAPKHFKDLLHSLLEEKTTTVDLECLGCPYAAARSDDTNTVIWQEGVQNSIHLEFDTHDNGFNVNGKPLLPLERAQQSSQVMIMARQNSDSGDVDQSVEVSLSFALEVLPAIPSPHRDDVSLIPVELTILSMDTIPVKVNTIALKLIQTPANTLVIVNVEEVPFNNTPGAETCQNARPWTMCRIKAIFASRIKEIMEAAREKTDKVHGWVKDKAASCGADRGFWGHPHPHPHGEHTHGDHPHRPHGDGSHGNHHHHRYHRVGHAIHQALRFFVIPALLGIIGGLTASAIGMLVGQAIVYLWIRTYRNGQRGPLRLCERDVVIIEESEGLLDAEDEVLPLYEDAPKYEEVLSEKVEHDGFIRDSEKH